MLPQRKSLAFVAHSGEKYLIFCFSKCVNKLLLHLQKLSTFSKTCFTTTKETPLAPFNLAHVPGRSVKKSLLFLSTFSLVQGHSKLHC